MTEPMLVEKPAFVLEDQESVLLVVEQAGNEACHAGKPVKSLWINNLIREIRASGKYPYNRDVYFLAEDRLGLPRTDPDTPDKRKTLSWLVYYAQTYTRVDDLKALGYQPLTQELVDRAYREGKKVEIHLGEPYIVVAGAEPKTTATYAVRQMSGVCYVVPPRTRNKCIPPQGQPAKLV
jgi:hypothetical protein